MIPPISRCRIQAVDDHAVQMAALFDGLERLSAEEVVSFDTHFRACMKAANRTEIFAAATIIDEAVFEAALADADSLAEVLEPGGHSRVRGFPIHRRASVGGENGAGSAGDVQ